jgi:hypothetical protein
MVVTKEFKLFLSNTLNNAGFKTKEESQYYETLDHIIDYIESEFIAKDELVNLINRLIKSDNETLKIKRVGNEGKIAAQASKNALTLLKEQLNK